MDEEDAIRSGTIGENGLRLFLTFWTTDVASETHKPVQMFHLAGRKIFTIPLQRIDATCF